MPILRSAFLALSRNRSLRRFCESSPIGRRMSSRFVAGLDMSDALRVAESLNREGIAVTLDVLGESVASEAQAQQAAEVYHELLRQITSHKLNANISVKLTQMSLSIHPALAERIAEGLALHAAQTGSFLRIDMEDSSLTQATLDIVRRIYTQPALNGAIGIVIQSYLYRSKVDIEQLLADNIRIRLCKGAYNEPASVAFPNKSDVDNNYITLAKLLLSSPVYHAFATHDESMIAAIKSFAADNRIDPSRFEFQMLFGVRRDLQRSLVQQGYNVRVYLPFGREWYPYFMRRLAERPANALFLARNFFRS